MAYVQKTKGGYRVRHRDGGRGSRFVSSPVFPTKGEATDAKRRMVAQLDARGPSRPGAVDSLETIIARWSSAKIATGKDPLHTAGDVSRAMAAITANGWKSAHDITPQAVEKWRVSGASPRTGAILRAILRWASERDNQPVDMRTLVALRPGRVPHRPRATLVSDQQVAGWQNKADDISDSAGALIHCLATYCWRPITAARMTVSSVNFSAGTIDCQVKGGDTVRHPLRPDTVERLRAICAGRSQTDPLFLDPRTGTAWGLASARTSSQWFRDRMIGHIYDLKRWGISAMLRAGMSAPDIQLYTGHRTPGQVLRYGVSSEDRARLQFDRLPVAHGGAPRQTDHDKNNSVKVVSY